MMMQVRVMMNIESVFVRGCAFWALTAFVRGERLLAGPTVQSSLATFSNPRCGAD